MCSRRSRLLRTGTIDNVRLGWFRFGLLGLSLLRFRLAMGNEVAIARSTRPRRHIGGHAAGPMRPMIGDKAAAAREIKPKSEQSCRCDKPPGGHKAAGCLARGSISQSVGIDSIRGAIRGGTMVLKSYAL